MTPIEASIERRRLITEMDNASAKFVEYAKPHRNNMGLVSDAIRQGETYRNLNYDYQKAKAHLASFLKLHKGKEYQKEYQKAFKAETNEHYKQKRSK